jgi:very-short-patch-repair endonuclease
MRGSPTAKFLRKKSTWAEKLVWRWLRDRRFTKYKFRRQHPVGEYFIDFFCAEAKLSIELDGSQHGFPKQQAHDVERKKFLESRGIKELRFWNSQLRRNSQSIRDTIFRELQERAPHPLPDYTRPMLVPHPSPLPKGEGIAKALRSSVHAISNLTLPPLPPLPPGEGRGEGLRETQQ